MHVKFFLEFSQRSLPMKSILVIFATLFLSLIAQADPCVPLHLINGFHGLDKDSISVGRGQRTYIITTRNCHELAYADNIGFKTWPSGAAQVCRGDDLLIFDMGGALRDSCPIISIRKKE